MDVTRASFLRSLGMAIAVARIDPIGISGGFRVDRAERSHFEPLVGEPFTVFPEDSGRARLRLAKVVEKWSTANVTQFSLIFHGPAEDPIAQGIHEFRHPALGSFSIFISRIGAPTPERCVYQACFSRHVRT